MANLIFNSYNEMAEYMIGCDERMLLASALAYAGEATEIIRSLMMYDIGIGCIDIAQCEIDGYSDEYLVSVVDAKIFVEKAFNVENKNTLNLILIFF